jgi:hypothetical protein
MAPPKCDLCSSSHWPHQAHVFKANPAMVESVARIVPKHKPVSDRKEYLRAYMREYMRRRRAKP